MSYGRFSGFLGPLGCSEEKFKCLGGFLGAFQSDFIHESIKILFAKIQSCGLMTVFRVLVLAPLRCDFVLVNAVIVDDI